MSDQTKDQKDQPMEQVPEVTTSATKNKVIVIGGGVGGLSAAHMLVNRGFDVEVYERHCVPGGKARSYGIAGTGTDGRQDLPAEHGFRFVPAYYRHLPQTMEEIPYWDTGETVEDQLIQVRHESFTRFTAPPMIFPSKLPTSFIGWFHLYRQMKRQNPPKLKISELIFYTLRIWQVFSSCHERRDVQYEQIDWWQFVGAETKSANYRNYLANMSRTLVAANPHYVSTRTNGNSWLQMILGMWKPKPDRILKGPTNEMWIYPWLHYLLGKGVKYFVNAEAVEYLSEDGTMRGVRFTQAPKQPKYAGPQELVQVLDCDRYGITKCEPVTLDVVTGDEYVSAVPVERMAKIITQPPEASAPFKVNWQAIAEQDKDLQKIQQLAYSVQNMNGIQFYLRPTPGQMEAPNQMGHSINADSPFALTAIFQGHYWPDIDLSQYGNGDVTNILSVDISDWTTGQGRIYHKVAQDCTREQIKEECWEDIKTCLRLSKTAHLDDGNLVEACLDFDIAADPHQPYRNDEPLLVSRVNTHRLRPAASTRIDGLYLASDYVDTYTDLATMEGANEAARRAVNAILTKHGISTGHLGVYPLEEPEIFKPFRDYDEKRFKQGKPWSIWFPPLMMLKLMWFFFLKLIGWGK
ncbi:MAG: FAD-dependent oxidoreductase [Pseudomonadota bacterium]